MSFAAKIRLYLIAVAILPPLAVMGVIYFHSAQKAEELDRENANREVQKYLQFRQSYGEEVKSTVAAVAVQPAFTRALLMLNSGKPGQIDLSNDSAWLDFLELVNSSGVVLASAHRPAMIGDSISLPPERESNDSPRTFETLELDRSGSHPALAVLAPVGNNIYVYAGNYYDSSYLTAARTASSADLNIRLYDQNRYADYLNSQMESGVLYLIDDQYQALVGGGVGTGFYMTATLRSGTQRPVFRSLIIVTGLVAAGSVLLAILIGFYVSHRTKREFDNLLAATARVAAGDLSTPVMAYEEKEFAHLAEAFSDMIVKLRSAQASLAVSQKIAAWQVMGRKVAHEVKNPLTPITICADDLRRSYLEKLPEFDKTLERNTAVIKSEVQRVTKLLDQFVAFARMTPPVKREVSLAGLMTDLEALYPTERASGRLKLANECGDTGYRIDPEQIKQLLVNLIKNGFESSESTMVDVKAQERDGNLVLSVLDTGPGFSPEKLARGFEPYLSSKKDGSGLGLVICQRIAVDHGGNIELFNRPEGGAGVRVTLPAN
ncbi:hypothetical protein C3F09_08085 [candidate division GN15 bacterium]|uniref:histidine kinase n=1 Tax=candidate division GN15 bacterium TaxID=2072418 RepID=A0A855X607_9BACT|nr:MAG: hypothetical protein C3F09_08085 [candidate division GN15 bacterium]